MKSNYPVMSNGEEDNVKKSHYSLIIIFTMGLFLPLSNPAFGMDIITLKQIETLAKRSPEVQQKSNDVNAARQEINILHAEGSPILQGRIKAGHYTHFNYDGIPRAYILKPKLGLKYYLFGGNKYLRHITSQAQPAYYKKLSFYDAEVNLVQYKLLKNYIEYWKDYKLADYLRHFIRLFKNKKWVLENVKSILQRMRLSIYVAHMRAEIRLHKMIEITGHKIHQFVPVRPHDARIKKQDIPSTILKLHPAIDGLISYYHGQKQLGFLRFIDVKLMLFARPSYYPAASRSKIAVIGGIYLNMPLDIMGAVHHANQQLDLDRENILLKLKEDALERKQNLKMANIKIPIYRRQIRFWKRRETYYLNCLHAVFTDHKNNHHPGHVTQKLPHDVRSYREALNKWIHADAKLSLLIYRASS